MMVMMSQIGRNGAINCPHVVPLSLIKGRISFAK